MLAGEILLPTAWYRLAPSSSPEDVRVVTVTESVALLIAGAPPIASMLGSGRL
jgi:hypothetical protein